jgi:hypothetical protein
LLNDAANSAELGGISAILAVPFVTQFFINWQPTLNQLFTFSSSSMAGGLYE